MSLVGLSAKKTMSAHPCFAQPTAKAPPEEEASSDESASAESGDESEDDASEPTWRKLDVTMRLALDLVHTVWNTHATSTDPGADTGPGSCDRAGAAMEDTHTVGMHTCVWMWLDMQAWDCVCVYVYVHV